MNRKNRENTEPIIPFFSVDAPFDLAYRKSSTSTPVMPHTHNALELYLTLTDLPDVLLDDTVSSVPKYSLIVIPPYFVHQLFNQKLTVYERCIITINTNWLRNVLGEDFKLMTYASPQSSPAIITLNEDQARNIENKVKGHLSKYRTSSIEAYTDFFSIFNCQRRFKFVNFRRLKNAVFSQKNTIH